MAPTPGQLDTRDALAVIGDALDRVDPDRGRLPDAERLALVQEARVLAGRLDALLCALLAEADRAESSRRASGTPSSSWLALTGNLSKKESAGLLYKARAVTGNPDVRDAALSGRIGVGQARAIATVLDDLPPQLTPAQRDQAAQVLVGMASRLDAAGITAAASDVLRTVAPEDSAELLAERLQRQAEAAHRKRALTFYRDNQGSVTFRGSLPAVAAEGWIAIIDAHVESKRRTALEARDPAAPILTPEQRRADGLIDMIHDHQSRRLAPTAGGDRPRVVVTLDYDRLRDRAIEAGVIHGGQQIGAGDLRRLCCDADLIPAVLGGPSTPLDLGTRRRLVTPSLRGALTLRDGGCVFPGCDTHPTACQAHHITPWWLGGPTALSNLVLLCQHHHGLVEPAKYGIRDQWGIRLDAQGIPELVPPRRFDAHQTPIRHQRFRRPRDAESDRPAAAGFLTTSGQKPMALDASPPDPSPLADGGVVDTPAPVTERTTPPFQRHGPTGIGWHAPAAQCCARVPGG